MCRNLEILNKIDQQMDFIVDSLPDSPELMDSNVVANFVAEMNTLGKFVDKIKAEDKEYAPVIRLHQSEMEHYGGAGLDLNEVAEKVGEVFMSSGYWDVLKEVIQIIKKGG